MGIISILPALIAVVLAFYTKNTIVALLVACFTGTLLAGQGLFGLPTVIKVATGTTSFSWVMLLNMYIAIIVAYFHKTGAIQAFSAWVDSKHLSRKGAQLLAWLLGIFVYFSDSFSPLFTGTVMRDITDKAKISKEKLSYIADSTAAPVSVLVPITGWAAYLMSLAVGIGCIATTEDAQGLFLKAIPLNFYPILAVILVGLTSSGIVPDFGPMKKAEERAIKEGKVLRDGAEPLIGKEISEMTVCPKIKPNVFLNFVAPILFIIAFALGTFFVLGSAKTMEAFLFTVILMSISLLVQGVPFKELMDAVMTGIKSGVPAVTLLALAYALKEVSTTMGTANFIITACEGFLSPAVLPAVIFIIASIMAFATGSSWGTFAICMPIALPLAFAYTNDTVTLLVIACFAAVAGGGVFGDHCSPVSDTTILASTGAGADHIDHVKSQLPYSLVCGSISVILYLILGFTSM